MKSAEDIEIFPKNFSLKDIIKNDISDLIEKSFTKIQNGLQAAGLDHLLLDQCCVFGEI